MYGKSDMETYITVCKIDNQREFAVWLVAQVVKNLPAVQESWVQSLGQKDPLEKEMATHSGILAWEISWTEKPSRLQSVGLQNSQI